MDAYPRIPRNQSGSSPTRGPGSSLPAAGTVVIASVEEDLGDGMYALRWAGNRISVTSRAILTPGQSLILKSEISPEGKATLVVQGPVLPDPDDLIGKRTYSPRQKTGASTGTGDAASGSRAAADSPGAAVGGQVAAGVTRNIIQAPSQPVSSLLGAILEPLPDFQNTAKLLLSQAEREKELWEKYLENEDPEKTEKEKQREKQEKAAERKEGQSASDTAGSEKSAKGQQLPEAMRQAVQSGTVFQTVAEQARRAEAALLPETPPRDENTKPDSKAEQDQAAKEQAAKEGRPAPNQPAVDTAAKPETREAAPADQGRPAPQPGAPPPANTGQTGPALPESPTTATPPPDSSRPAHQPNQPPASENADTTRQPPVSSEAPRPEGTAPPETRPAPPPATAPGAEAPQIDLTTAQNNALDTASSTARPETRPAPQPAERADAPRQAVPEQPVSRDGAPPGTPPQNSAEPLPRPADPSVGRTPQTPERDAAPVAKDTPPPEQPPAADAPQRRQASPAPAAPANADAKPQMNPEIFLKEALTQLVKAADLPLASPSADTQALGVGSKVPEAIADKAATILLRAAGLTPDPATLEAAKALVENSVPVDRTTVQAMLALAAGVEDAGDQEAIFKAAARQVSRDIPLAAPLASGLVDVMDRKAGVYELMDKAAATLAAEPRTPETRPLMDAAKDLINLLHVDLGRGDAAAALERYVSTFGRETLGRALAMVESSTQAVLENHPDLGKIDKAMAAILRLLEREMAASEAGAATGGASATGTGGATAPAAPLPAGQPPAVPPTPDQAPPAAATPQQPPSQGQAAPAPAPVPEQVPPTTAAPPPPNQGQTPPPAPEQVPPEATVPQQPPSPGQAAPPASPPPTQGSGDSVVRPSGEAVPKEIPPESVPPRETSERPDAARPAPAESESQPAVEAEKPPIRPETRPSIPMSAIGAYLKAPRRFPGLENMQLPPMPKVATLPPNTGQNPPPPIPAGDAAQQTATPPPEQGQTPSGIGAAEVQAKPAPVDPTTGIPLPEVTFDSQGRPIAPPPVQTGPTPPPPSTSLPQATPIPLPQTPPVLPESTLPPIPAPAGVAGQPAVPAGTFPATPETEAGSPSPRQPSGATAQTPPHAVPDRPMPAGSEPALPPSGQRPQPPSTATQDSDPTLEQRERRDNILMKLDSLFQLPGVNRPEVELLKPSGLLDRFLNSGRGKGDQAASTLRDLLADDPEKVDKALKDLSRKDPETLRETASRLARMEREIIRQEPLLSRLADAAGTLRDLGRQLLAVKAENLAGQDRNPAMMLAEVPFKLADNGGDGRMQMFYRKSKGSQEGWSSRVILDLNTTSLGPVLGDMRFFGSDMILNMFVEKKEMADFLSKSAEELTEHLLGKGFRVKSRFMVLPPPPAPPEIRADRPEMREESAPEALSVPGARRKGRLDTKA